MAEKWIRRRGKKPGRYKYFMPPAQPVPEERARQIDALAIPPAWTDVHIAKSERSAIQAWGYDARGRKQYKYHPRAVAKGQLRKYYRVRQMARDLPEIRRKLYSDFKKKGLPKERVLAGVVRFLADGFFRVGNERYARENHTFGISTLNKSHVRVTGDAVVFKYVGKRSIEHKQVVVSRELAAFIEELLQTPGRRLFRYLDDGCWCNVDAQHVNDYVQSLAQFPYSAKDFRTWGGTLRAATVLAELGAARNETEGKRNVVTAMRLVAAELGNTPAICRASYVHPVVIDRYLRAGETIAWERRSQRKRAPSEASARAHRRGSNARGRKRGRESVGAHAPEERALIEFLDKHFPERRKQRRTDG